MTAEYSITLSYTDLEDLYGELAAFMSPEGMFIPIARTRPVGTRLDFDLVAEAEGARIAGSGEVAWVVGRMGSHPAGMAVRFEELAEGSAEILARAVERRTQAGEPPFDVYRGEGPGEEAAAPVRAAPEALAKAEPEPTGAAVDDALEAPPPAPQTDADDAVAELEATRSRLAALEGELAAAREGAATAAAVDLEAAEGGIDALKAEREEDQRKIAVLEAELQEARSDAAKPSAELDAARNRIAALESELEGARGEAEGARGELETARAGVVELETRLEAANVAAEEPRSELKTARRRLDEADRELAKSRDRADKAAAELAEAQGRLAELEEEAGKSSRLEAARLASEERVATLETELQAARAEAEETRERAGKLESELGEARQGLEAAASLRDELEAARGAEAARASLERELDGEREGVARMQLLVDRVRGEHATLQEELVAAQAALARSQEEKQGLRTALEEARVIEMGADEAGDETGEGPYAEVYESAETEAQGGRRWGAGRLLLAALAGLVLGAAATALALNLLG